MSTKQTLAKKLGLNFNKVIYEENTQRYELLNKHVKL